MRTEAIFSPMVMEPLPCEEEDELEEEERKAQGMDPTMHTLAVLEALWMCEESATSRMLLDALTCRLKRPRRAESISTNEEKREKKNGVEHKIAA